MKILSTKVTDGPNYWSVRRSQLIVMLLDLEELEDRPTNMIDGFYERITTLLPSLYAHRCSEGEPGGFFHRIKMGTWMGHVIEHLALELQTLAGMFAGFGRTRGAGRRGLYHVVFTYQDAEAGRYAAEAAVRLAGALIEGRDYDLAGDLAELRGIWNRNKPGPSTAAILAEARKRDIPVLRLNNDSLYQLGYGCGQRRIQAALASTTSNIAVDLAGDKEATKRILKENGIPVPAGSVVTDEEGLDRVIGEYGYPLAIKPVDGNHGRGATLNIQGREEAVQAMRVALCHSREAICERFIPGDDYRVLVVNYKVVAAAKRSPAAVEGDGAHTVRELIELTNQAPERGDQHDNVLTRITVDAGTMDLLRRQGYGLDSVPEAGTLVRLKDTANLSTGGTAEDVTDRLHPVNRMICERIARVIGLDICGIDLISRDVALPMAQNGGCVLEVNASPGLRMHLHPSTGQPRNVAGPILDLLFPNGQDGRIPIIAVTGTNGKTTTTRLIAEIGQQAGHVVGVTTTNGVYIAGQPISSGDCTGPSSARQVLKDPSVGLAVLECARGGILRAGLGFDRCDIAVITNIAEDHLGIQGIDTLEQLTRLKGTVAESVSPEGYAVLNADDERVAGLADGLHCRIAYFSMDADNPIVRRHVGNGGIAALYENGWLTVIEEGTMLRVCLAEELPITFGGTARFNIANALAAALAGYLQGIDKADIRTALRGFVPTAENLPGRMNVFDFGGFKIIADYAHNTHGLRAVGPFLRDMAATIRVGVIAGVGDRRDEDIISLGAEAARVFDEIIIRQDGDLRGRDADELNGLVLRGIRMVDAGKKVTIVRNEMDSVYALLERGTRGMVGTFFADDVGKVLACLEEARVSGKYYLKEMEVA